MNNDFILWLVVASGLLAAAYGWLETQTITKASAGNDRMKEIAAAIQEGARAYLNRQYSTIAMVGVGVVIVLAIAFWGVWQVPVGFLIGAVLSGAAGFVGMNVSVQANVRTAEASRTSLAGGLRMAFKAGSVTGMLVAGGALFGVAFYYLLLTTGFFGLSTPLQSTDRIVVDSLVALGFGASLISIFARLGGGIFTKGADVGGDMVGKVEAGIPEDDPRNPATIADNVGDNVGDCAGMAADLFETYAVSTVATMVLGSILFREAAQVESIMLLPLAIGGVAILACIIGSQFVRLGPSNNIMGALYKGLVVAGVLSAIGLYGAILATTGWGEIVPGAGITGEALFYCGLVGLAVTGAIVWITEYYTGTGFRPVKSVAQASVSGHGTNVIQGLAVSMESTALPALTIVAGIIACNALAGLFGIAIAVTTMLSVAGIIVALDAFGPVTDNAGGIAEMADLPKEVRVTTDALDAVGNTTKAVTKGYAIGSAGLGALVLFAAYFEDLKYYAAHPSEFPFFEGVVPRLCAFQSVRDCRALHRRLAALFVRRLVDDRGGARGASRGRGSAPPIPRNPRHHGTHRQAGLWPRRRYPHASGDQGNGGAVHAASARADRFVFRDLGAGRGSPGAGVGRRAAGRRDRHRLVRRHFDDLRRRRLGQCQEADRGRPSRRQGFGRAQGGRHGRHRRRSLQGYGGSGGEPDDQDHQHRRAPAAGGAGALELSRAHRAIANASASAGAFLLCRTALM